MAGYPQRQPPQDDDDDRSSLFSRTSIQNSPHWPSVRLPSPGPSVRTLNESDAGSYLDDLSSLANFSCDDLDFFSDRGSVLTANITGSPSSSRPSTPSSSSHEQSQPLSSENRADKRPDQPVLPPLVLSSRKLTIGSTSEFQDNSSYNGVSLLIDNFDKDLRQSVITDVVSVPPPPNIPDGDSEDRNKYSTDRQLVSTDANDTTIRTLCHACGLVMEGAFVKALGTIFHLRCFTCIDCGDVVATKFFPIDDPNESEKQHPLCERDYFRRLDLICAKCGEALRGSYITACKKKFHVEHFMCTLCPTLFGPHDSYYEHNQDVYCHYHYSTRFATKCVGCKTAILKQFVEINRNQRDECWHPECYMIHKFWNVKVVLQSPHSPDTTDPPYVEEERQESRASLMEKQIKMEQRVYRIWTVLSTFEESSAATVTEMLRYVSNGSYLEAIRTAERTVLHVEVLFATIDDLEWHFAWLGLKGMSHVRESRMLCRKLVDLFTLLSRTQETGARRTGMTQELLALVTGLAHYLKILIRIALTGALKLEREHGIGAIGPFLDKLHSLAVQKGSPSAHRMVAGAKDVASPSHSSASINTSTSGVSYGFRSLAPEVAGTSPFLDASQDFAISNIPVPSPPSDLCVVCHLTIEEDCVRLGTYQRWHSKCIRCARCGIDATPAATGNAEDKFLVNSGSGAGDGIVAKRVSTARRPPANVDLFVWWSDSIMDTQSFGQVPTAFYCKDHALPGGLGGFQAVSRLEQYAFLLNVALRRLHLLLKKQKIIPSTPSNTNPLPSGETNPDLLQELRRLHSVNLDRKLSATARIPKRSTVVESPAGEVAHSSDASPSKGNRPRSLPPEATPSDIPRLAEAGNTVEQGRSLPRPSAIADSPSGKVARSGDASISEGDASKDLLSVPTPSNFPRLGEPEKAAKLRRPLPPTPTDTEITLADIPRLVEASQLGTPQPMAQLHSTPPQNLTPYVAELTPLELAIVRHAAVAVLRRSSLRNGIDLDQILEVLEVKRQRFWERLFKPGNDRKKKGLFGVPLELLVERDGVDSLLGASRARVTVPWFIDDVISASRQMDMEVDFRMAGSIRRRKELINALERDPSSVDFSRERPKEIAFLLKHFLCELPDPLMTSKLQGLFIAAADLPNDEERKRLLHMLTLLLPKCHRDTLEVLLVFLKRVSSFTTVRDDIGTDSYPSNLAGVIGPNVLFSGNWVYNGGSRAMAELLENQDQFFTVPEEFLPLLDDQEFFAGSMEQSSKDFLKQCETYMRIKFGEPAGRSVRMRGKPTRG